jgi:UDPglucose 6-dehydrogenase
VPVGFTAQLERDWRRTDPSLQFACTPENLRLGQAIQVFRHPERVVLGTGEGVDRERLVKLFKPFSEQIEWMSPSSAEMTKHALNGFLALSVSFTNELARICERVGADATEVERGLRSEPRIGKRAYVSPGPPIAGGTLLRDIGFLSGLAAERGLESPVIDAVQVSNQLHQQWTLNRTLELLAGIERPRAAVLGLTYKPGTDTLRRSSSLGLAQALAGRGVQVTAFDPVIRTLPDTTSDIELAAALDAALDGADVAILATAWPEFRALTADRLVGRMRRPCLVDQAGFLPHLAGDPRLIYVRVGQPPPGALEMSC